MSPYHRRYIVKLLRERRKINHLSVYVTPVTRKPNRFGGIVVSVLATGHKGCGLEPGQGDGFFKGDKNPHHIFLLDGN
jgi:hypothetical protein